MKLESSIKLINAIILVVGMLIAIIASNYFALGAFLIATGWSIIYYDLKKRTKDE